MGLVACIAALTGLASPASAFHTVFDFTVDRFEADGNLLGPFDGTPDFVDDFDGTSTPNWYTSYGTSSVSGGRLHVQSPGTHLPGPDGLLLDLTEVTSYPSHIVQKGAGNFTATAIFDPVIPPEQHFYHFTIYTFGGGNYFNELFGVDIHTVDGVTRIEQHLVILDLTHGIYQTVQTDGQTVTAADLTGELHFRVSYDDTAGAIVSAFSLDGGTTFQSPFPSAPIFTLGRNMGEFILGADPHIAAGATTTTTPTPTTTTTTILGFYDCLSTSCRIAPKNSIDFRYMGARPSSFSWAWKKGPAFPLAELGDPTAASGAAYALCVRDAQGTLLYRYSWLPAAMCYPNKPCWKPVGTKGFAWGHKPVYVVSSFSDSLKVLTGPKTSQVANTTKGATFLPPPMTPPVTVQLEDSAGGCWTSTFTASDVLVNDVTRFKAKTR